MRILKRVLLVLLIILLLAAAGFSASGVHAARADA